SKLLRFERAALRAMLQDYAREPGLRSLQQLVSRVARKAAARVISARSPEKGSRRQPARPIVIKADELISWLGPKRFYNELAERITAPGVAVGLAWTEMGGEI